jgi:hypothetical protein
MNETTLTALHAAARGKHANESQNGQEKKDSPDSYHAASMWGIEKGSESTSSI